MQINDKIAVVTGAAGGIGQAIARQLVIRRAAAVAIVDLSDQCDRVAEELNVEFDREVARPFSGNVADPEFRARVFSEMASHDDIVRICVPAAGILRDGMAVRLDRETGKSSLYDEALFRTVLDVNLIHPVYWAMEMLSGVVQQRADAGLKKWEPHEEIQGSVVLVGSVSARGNRGQISYASAKSGLNGAAKTLDVEGMQHGVQTRIVHPGLVNTPMIEQLPDGFFDEHVKPTIALGRLIEPAEIASAVALLIENPAISGQLWIDAGLRPMA